MVRKTKPSSFLAKIIEQKKRIVIFLISVLGVLPLATLLIIPSYKNAEGFKTLSEVEKYAAAFDETKISMENTNLVKPDYTNFYTAQQKGFFGAKLQKLGLAQKLPWTAHTYKNYFEQLVKAGKEKQLTGNFLYKITPAATAKIIVWGDIQGALHSLTRGLRELVKQGILGEDLKVTNPEHYLIFMGDVTSRSPFLMETLSLVARLMLSNPDNVFYIRGNHESSNYWQGHGLKTELKIRAEKLGDSTTKEEFPLEALSNAFFDTLPTAIYLGAAPEHERIFVRLSHEGVDGESKIGEINDTKMSPFLATKITAGKIAVLNYKDLKEGTAPAAIAVKALLKAEVKRKTYQSMDGLRLLSPENGINAWSMLSCPTEVYRKGLEYFYDAFVVIQAGAKIEDWTITLNNQDVRTLQGFKTRSLNLISGQLLSGTPAPTEAPAATTIPPATQPATSTQTQVSLAPVALAPQATLPTQPSVPQKNPLPVPTPPSITPTSVQVTASQIVANPPVAIVETPPTVAITQIQPTVAEMAPPPVAPPAVTTAAQITPVTAPALQPVPIPIVETPVPASPAPVLIPTPTPTTPPAAAPALTLPIAVQAPQTIIPSTSQLPAV